MAKARAKTKAKATAKASATAAAMTTAVARSVATWSAGNLRGRERRAATRAMNELAVEVGVRKVRLKAKAAHVEALARSLEARCRNGDLLARGCGSLPSAHFNFCVSAEAPATEFCEPTRRGCEQKRDFEAL